MQDEQLWLKFREVVKENFSRKDWKNEFTKASNSTDSNVLRIEISIDSLRDQ